VKYEEAGRTKAKITGKGRRDFIAEDARKSRGRRIGKVKKRSYSYRHYRESGNPGSFTV
jgi:hypothetical protein